MPTKHSQKCKLLLDEGLPLKQRYQKLNNFHDLKHIKHDFKKGGLKDLDIYNICLTENRILVTFNIRDFRSLQTTKKHSIIALSPNLSNKQTDLKIFKLLKEIRSNELSGYIISISKSETVVKRVLK